MVRKRIHFLFFERFGMFLSVVVCVASSVCSCSQSSPTVIASPAKGSVGGVDAGTLNPMITGVSPGSLQSLDIPLSVPSGIMPSAPGITVVFSEIMANNDGEMASAFALYDTSDSAAAVPLTVSPSASSPYFILTPAYPVSTGIAGGCLKPSTTYQLRIYQKAHAETLLSMTWYDQTAALNVYGTVSRAGNIATVVMPLAHGLETNQLVNMAGITAAGLDADDVTVTVVDSKTFTYSNTGADAGAVSDGTGTVETFNRTLLFHNLVASPATTISPVDPDYVVYSFTTGTDSAVDIQPPSFVLSYPSDGASAVDPSAPGGSDAAGGFLQFVFSDNLVPMIDPSTVNDLSVTLYNDTDGSSVTADSIGCVYTDPDYKTFRFYTNALLSAKHYTLTIGTASYRVTDFAGNKALPVTIGFSTQ